MNEKNILARALLAEAALVDVEDQRRIAVAVRMLLEVCRCMTFCFFACFAKTCICLRWLSYCIDVMTMMLYKVAPHLVEGNDQLLVHHEAVRNVQWNTDATSQNSRCQSLARWQFTAWS